MQGLHLPGLQDTAPFSSNVPQNSKTLKEKVGPRASWPE